MGPGHVGAKAASLLAALSAVAAACDPPGPASLPPAEQVGPPSPAAFACSPPYARFAGRAFRWADLDQGRSCSVFLEQDECVLGVYRDCTASAAREWQGEIDAANSIRLRSFSPGAHSPMARQPRCCTGALERPSEGPAWARLHCSTVDCASPHHGDHLGLYLEAAEAVRPQGTIGAEAQLDGPVVSAQGPFALIAGQGLAADGVWRVDGPAPRRVRSVADGRVIALAPSEQVWLATGARVLGPGGREWALPSPPLAMAAWSEGAVVALADRLLWFDLSSSAAVREEALGDTGVPAAVFRPPGDTAVYLLTGDPTQVVRFPPPGEPPTIESLGPSRGGPPIEAAWLDDAIVFVNRCHDQASVAHCLVTYLPQSGRLDRLGLASREGLGRPVQGPPGRWWVPDRQGFVHVVRTDSGRRPDLAAAFDLPDGVGFLTRDTAIDRWYAFGLTDRRVWTVERASGTD